LELSSGSSTVVEQLLQDLKFKGLNLAAAGIGRKIEKKVLIRVLRRSFSYFKKLKCFHWKMSNAVEVCPN
jgi:hypothetical protein